MWMEHNGFSDYAPSVVDKAIDGPKLLTMDRATLQSLGIMPATEQKKFLQLVSELKGADNKLVRLGSNRSIKAEYTTTADNGVSLNSESVNGKDYWNHAPTNEKIVFKCFLEGKRNLRKRMFNCVGRDPWCILVDSDTTLVQLEKRIQKAFGNFKIQYKEDDMVMPLEV